MKQFIIIALILIVSVTANAQQKEKQISVTISYNEAIFIKNYTQKVDSLLATSEVATKKTLPLFNLSASICNLLQEAYNKELKKVDTTKKVTNSKKQ